LKGFVAKNDTQLSQRVQAQGRFLNAFAFAAPLRYDRFGFVAKNDTQVSFS